MQFWSSLTESEPKAMNFCGLEALDAELMEPKCTDACCPQYFSFPCFSHRTIRNVAGLECFGVLLLNIILYLSSVCTISSGENISLTSEFN